MQRSLILAALLLSTCAFAQAPDAPTNEKAQETYKKGLENLRKGQLSSALDCFKKADKQDGGHCIPCQKQIIDCAMKARDWKAAANAANEQVSEARDPRDVAVAHFNLALILFNQEILRKKDEGFSRVHEELTQALSSYPKFPDAVFLDGQALAHMRRDDEAKARFQTYLTMSLPSATDKQRATRFVKNIELARSRMAPPFAVTTLDGQRVSLDDLSGKVVLLDFWATWCGPCRRALPHMQEIAKKFETEPFVILSVSLDDDEAKWKEYVSKNSMTWLQYRDGGFKGPVSELFEVYAIPQTFTIDADGVLQDRNIGDASVEGDLRKLIARARQLQAAAK